VTGFSYDGLNRLKFVGFNTVTNGNTTTYESTISYTYDAGNRMTQAVDSAGGTITRTYDGLDRLTNETTAKGSITYTYDNADRLSTMQVAGQPQVGYTYDNADRLTQISQGSSTTSFGYDNGNRKTSLALPNNVVVSYTYDNGSRLTGFNYRMADFTPECHTPMTTVRA
jgi:YD repeat-containing protein